MRKAVGFLCAVAVFCACGCKINQEKNITVIAREKGSGTREAFDKVVTDGAGNFLEMKINGKKVYKTTLTATELTKTSFVISSVANDKNAIGYVSIGALNDSVKTVSIDGVKATAQAVLDGSYSIQRPFVIMTNASVTPTPRTADFLSYLYSNKAEEHANVAGCIFLSEPTRRSAEGIPVIEYVGHERLPAGDKIIVRGSTSVEKFITSAAKGYADHYGVSATDVFDIQLEGSSVGRKAVETDESGNVIGLSSATIEQENLKTFNVCLDAVAVIVNRANDKIDDLTAGQLYGIYTGKITKFSEIA